MANNIDDMGSPFRDHILEDLEMVEQDAMQPVEDIIRERDEYKDKWLRAVADSQNAKKHYQAEADSAFDRGRLQMVKALLPAIDDIERCLANGVDFKGVQLIHDKFMKLLEGSSFEKINPQNGDEFDENLHDALFIEVTGDLDLDGKIRSTLLPGYKMNGTSIAYPIVRHAQVTIWKAERDMEE